MVLHFLIDASLPGFIAGTIHAQGHSCTDVRHIGLASAPDQEIANHAKINQMCLLTADQDFGNIIEYPPAKYHGLVVFRPAFPATRHVIIKLVEQFLNSQNLMNQLQGRLAIVEPSRIRLRPKP